MTLIAPGRESAYSVRVRILLRGVMADRSARQRFTACSYRAALSGRLGQGPVVAARHSPVLPSLAGYRPSWLRADVSAGLAIAAVGLPSAIAYPAIAGLPPETGLYASIAPLVAYALFGPSRQLIVGPDAAAMTVLAALLATVPASDERVGDGGGGVLALVVGGLCLGGARAAPRGARDLPVAPDPDRLLRGHLALDPRRSARPVHRHED